MVHLALIVLFPILILHSSLLLSLYLAGGLRKKNRLLHLIRAAGCMQGQMSEFLAFLSESHSDELH